MDTTVRLTLNGLIRDCGSKVTLIQNGEEVPKFLDLILLQDSISKFCDRAYWILNLSRVHEGDYDQNNNNNSNSSSNSNRRSRNSRSNNNDDENNNNLPSQFSPIFGPMRERVVEGWRKLFNYQRHDLYYSQNVIRANKSRKMRRVGRVVCMGRKENHEFFCEENLKEKTPWKT